MNGNKEDVQTWVEKFIKNYNIYVKRYVRINTEELNFLKGKTIFSFEYVNPGDTCYFQGTQETLVDTTLINIGEGILGEALVRRSPVSPVKFLVN